MPATQEVPAPNVLLICWDTVRADHLTPYGYERHDTTPRLAALADESTLFEDAWSTAGWTKPSVSSFLTGLLPARHGVYEGSSKSAGGHVSDALPKSTTTLAELFQAAGYRTAAFVKNGHLRPGLGLEQGFDTYRDGVGGARAIRWEALDWLDSRDDGRPFFLYVHMLDAHWPYDVPDAYAARYAELDTVNRFRDEASRELIAGINNGEIEFGSADERALNALYDGALRYLDDQLGMLLDGLERRGLGSEMVIAFVSDHGESLGEQGRIGHGHGLSDELLSVPFLLRIPGATPRRVSIPVSLLDLAPTLLEAAGLSLLDDFDGRSLIGSIQPHPSLAEHKAPDRYMHAIRERGLIYERSYRAPRPAPDSFALGIGDRFEVRLTRNSNGELSALELDESDDPADDPIELKGRLSSCSEDFLELEGISIPLEPGFATVLAKGAEGIDLAAGCMVKVRLIDSKTRTANWIKIYAPSAEYEFEVRAPLQAVSGRAQSGALTLAGLEINVNGATEVDVDLERRLDRAQLAEIWSDSARGIAPEGLEVDAVLRRTGSAADLQPPLDDSDTDQSSTELQQRLAAIYSKAEERRFWTGDEAPALLDDDTVDALRELGYVR